MKMILKQLKLTNFKGVRDLTVNFDEMLTELHGHNGEGKTTVNDAFKWLITDKDSMGNSIGADIKTIDTGTEEVIHMLDHSAEAIIIVDGKTITLKKLFKEKYTKKNGETELEFTGHTTNYWIDETPVKKSDYSKFTDEIAESEAFRLVTDLGYFASLTTEKKRVLIMSMANCDDSAVFASDSNLSRLSELIGDKSLSDFKKTVKDKMKPLIVEKDGIQPKVDERFNMIKEIEAINFDEIRTELAGVDEKIKSETLKSTGSTSYDPEHQKKQKQYFDKRTQLNNMHSSLTSGLEGDKRTLTSKISQIETSKNSDENSLRTLNQSIEGTKKTIEITKNTKDGYSKEYMEERAKTFELKPEDKNCPTCGEVIKNLNVAELENNFKTAKAQTLKSIGDKGKPLAVIIEDAEKSLLSETEKATELENKISDFIVELVPLKTQLDELNAKKPLEDMAYQSLAKEVVELSKFETIHPIENPDAIEAGKNLEGLNATRDALKDQLSKESQIAGHNTRIEELSKRQKELSAMITDLEGQLNLISAFGLAKVNMIEKDINSKFKITKFRMFEHQINGGIKEVCVPMVDGKPYNGAMNLGLKKNVDLDIINAFSKHYDVSAPVFCDNMESVNEMITSESQLIKSFVIPLKDGKRIAKGIEVVGGSK